MSQSKAQASFRKNLHNGCEQMDLAWTYYEDGALESMARCLEEAAKLFRRAAEQKNFMLLRNGAKRVNIPLDKLMIDPKVIKPKKADPPKPPDPLLHGDLSNNGRLESPRIAVMPPSECRSKEEGRMIDELAMVQKFHRYLQGDIPKEVKVTKIKKMNPDQAMAVIWFLQEVCFLVDSRYEMCHTCKVVYDSYAEGTCKKTGHCYCDNCIPAEC